jgi:hypothetical protein
MNGEDSGQARTAGGIGLGLRLSGLRLLGRERCCRLHEVGKVLTSSVGVPLRSGAA